MTLEPAEVAIQGLRSREAGCVVVDLGLRTPDATATRAQSQAHEQLVDGVLEFDLAPRSCPSLDEKSVRQNARVIAVDFVSSPSRRDCSHGR